MLSLLLGCNPVSPPTDDDKAAADSAVDSAATESGPPSDSDPVDTGTPPLPPDADWLPTAGPRLLSDGYFDNTGYSLAIGPATNDPGSELLVDSPWQFTYAYGYNSRTDPCGWLGGAWLVASVPDGSTASLFEASVLGVGGAAGGGTIYGGGAVALPGDLTGDGSPDLIANSAGKMSAYAATDSDGCSESGSELFTVDGDLDDWGSVGFTVAAAAGTRGGGLLASLYPLGGIGPFGIGQFDAPLVGALTADAATWTVASESSGNFYALVSADLDGDGEAEVAAGAPYAFDQSGAVFVFTPPTPGVFQLDDVAEGVWVGEGGITGVTLGAGDIDGDGTPDLIVGGPGAGGIGGTVWVVGPEGGDLASAPFRFTSRYSGDFFGKGIASGDFDADGVIDLALGAPQNPYAAVRPGRVLVYGGPLPSGAHDEDDADRVWYATERRDSFGWALVAGELDGLPGDELVVGAPYDNELDIWAGSVTFLIPAL